MVLNFEKKEINIYKRKKIYGNLENGRTWNSSSSNKADSSIGDGNHGYDHWVNPNLYVSEQGMKDRKKRKAFKTNPMLMSYSKAFSGGLFISVGIIHLLYESNEKFEDYFER